MELNVSNILSETLTEMEQSGEAEKHVKEIFRKSVFSAIDSVLSGYKMKEAIEDKMKEQLPEIVNKIGLDGYVNYVSGVAQQVIKQVENDETRQKANKMMSSVLLKKRNSIKLSEIFKTYRDELMETLDEDERREADSFEANIKDEGSGSVIYSWWEISLSFKGKYDTVATTAQFSVHYGKDNTKGTFGTLSLDGKSCNKAVGFRNLSSFEALMLNLYFNRTSVEIDVTDPDNVDTSLWNEDY